MPIKLHLIIVYVAIIILSSCKSTRNYIGDGEKFTYNCPVIISYNQPEIISLNDYEPDSLLQPKYSDLNLHIANAFGLLSDLHSYEHLRERIKKEGRVDPNTFDEYSRAYNRLNEGMNLAALEVKSLQDLLDCSILKLRKFKFEVSNAILKSQNSLSNWAIGVGSATTIITAGILVSQDNDLIGSSAFDWMAVAGGVVTGYLAYRSAKVNRQIRLSPQSNFIRVIWTGNNENNLFPPASWYLINQKYLENGELVSVRENIIREWQESKNILGSPENITALPILLADEAVYTEELIDLRIEMLESIDLGVDQINRALYLFNSKRY